MATARLSRSKECRFCKVIPQIEVDTVTTSPNGESEMADFE
jgi:hypothetical protein